MLLNRDVFLKDPTKTTIPNLGVAKVVEPRSQEEWDVLRYELSSFVCEGEYREGLDRVLRTYIDSLGLASQPAVWVSGFYGSGKSHFVRVLEYLWRNVTFPDGASARSLVTLPAEIKEKLIELSTAGKQAGGLWSAAGTLGAGAGDSARLAVLGILLRTAGLPTQYTTARFALWLKQNGYFEPLSKYLEERGKTLRGELPNMFVSPVLANGMMEIIPGFAADQAGVRATLRAQYPVKNDISDDELLETVESILELQSDTPGKLPCTLLVFDELQQFIGEDSTKAGQVQNIVEACSSRFGSKILFVATGQAQLQSTPQLSKLQGRFTVRVMLEDTDVETVVREVVLRKTPDKVPALKAVLDQVSGEIDRQLAGTKIGPSQADSKDLVSDYPLLPVRRRFWEAVLRAVDSAGMAGQLRTQLRIVHETAKAVADKAVGWVVPGDVIYDQLKADMLQSSVLLREIAQVIEEMNDGTPDGELRARLCATAFLIGRLPTEGIAATGVRATVDVLADLLVEDLSEGSSTLRQRIPEVLGELVDKGVLMLVGGEYRLQTQESAQWQADFQGRYSKITGDDARIAGDRATELKSAVTKAMKGVSLIQGASKTPRSYELHFGAEAPATNAVAVPVWVRDEWSVSEKTVRQDAQVAGPESPVVFVFLPKREAEALRTAIANHAAAKETLETRPQPTTPEGIDATSAMQTRLQMERTKVDALISGVLGSALVFQGGGSEVAEGSLAESVKEAADAALVRLFPNFGTVDHPGWGKVVERAGQGAGDALSAVGYAGSVESHQACKAVLDFVGAGKKGSEVRKHFTGAGYGWPQDAVDGSLLALLAGGALLASKNGAGLTAKQIPQSQIGVIDFKSAGPIVTVVQRIAIRKLIQTDMGFPCAAGEEAVATPVMLGKLVELAAGAGGEAPLPEKPSTADIQQLQGLVGNEQLLKVYEQRDQLLAKFKSWSETKKRILEREPRWINLKRLMRHAEGLEAQGQVSPQVEAITAQRTLLADPDPVTPLWSQLATALRAALQTARQRLVEVYEQGMASLQASKEWQASTAADRERLLKENGVAPAPALKIGTDDELLASLDATSLADWREKTDALPTRVAKIREQAAKLLAPKAVKVSPPPATFNDISDLPEVERYVARLKDEIVTHLQDGKPVIL